MQELLPGEDMLSWVFTIPGIELSSLGIAYLILLANVVTTAACFIASRTLLIISPNSATREYGLYVSAILIMLIVATTLENELLPMQLTTLSYATIPHLLLLLMLHLWIYSRQEPWLVALGVSSIAGVIPIMILAGLSTDGMRIAHWLILALACTLLGFVWLKAISTKRGFLKARSIYISSKERPRAAAGPQTPWLGLPQWVALVCASVFLAALNALLRGGSLDQVPAVQILTEAVLLLGMTVLVCSIPTVTYWLARKAWMPELTRFVWLVWIVVGFAFTYGNFLAGLDRA